jgi:DNA phosphorothioation-dependent restriction protein DptH
MVIFELPSADPRAVNQTAWEVAEIVAYVCGLGEIQRGHVFDGLRQAYPDAGGVPSMAQFAAAVEDAEREARGKNARDRIRPSSTSACSRTDQETPSRRLGRTGQSST